ncbi:hypothetical protein Landi51_04682 [Colletotrichum acutatum]
MTWYPTLIQESYQGLNAHRISQRGSTLWLPPRPFAGKHHTGMQCHPTLESVVYITLYAFHESRGKGGPSSPSPAQCTWKQSQTPEPVLQQLRAAAHQTLVTLIWLREL